MIRTVAAGMVALGAMSGAAVAADATWANSAYNWTGFYVGAFAGAGSGSLTGLPLSSEGPSGVDAGLHLAYSYQTPGNWVFSPFVAIPLSHADGTVSGSIPFKVRWAVVGGLKLGYAIDRWQPYAFFAGVIGGGDAGVYGRQTHTGYATGVGFDYALSDRWSVGARYAYTSVGREAYGGYSVGMHASSFAATFSYKLF